MENCFRFLINVDQCLNMSYFDIFFYKLISQKKFHMSSVQMFGDTAQNSLRGAAGDIRAYLDKYPYHVGDYQIIVVMRTTVEKRETNWNDTMLYRLLSLDGELRDAHILINSREQTEKALNLIMLYDVDYTADLLKLSDYMGAGRLQQDCVQMLDLLSVCEEEQSLDVLDQALTTYRTSQDCDKNVVELLQAFFETRRKSYEQITAMPEPLDDYDTRLLPLSQDLTKFVRDRLCNMQLFEQQVDRNNRRQQTLALLRVVEFINMNTELSESVSNQTAIVPLVQRCADNWAKICLWIRPISLS